MRTEIAVWKDDAPQLIMERLTFNLMEIGIAVRVVQVLDEYIIYELIHAEPLPPEEVDNA